MCIKQRALRRLAGVLLCLNLLPLAMAEPVVLDGASQFTLHSRHTGRDYRIYLSVPAVPPPAGGYPVLYALDGDASFARLHQANPREASVFERLRQHGPVVPQPGVVVGIGYGRPFSQTMDLRAEDYTPPLSCQACALSSPRHGGADAFARFINEELKPEVARRLPLNPARQSLFGHSYGGLFTVYQLLRQPQSFQHFFAISPSLWFGDRALLAAPVPALPVASPRLLVLWVGQDEQPASYDLAVERQRQQRLQQNRMVSNTAELHARLYGLPGLVSDYRVVPGHDHGQMHGYAIDRALAIAFSPAWQPGH